MWTSPGAFDVLKVDVLILLTSPGAFEILCQVFQNELWRIFLLPDNWLKFDDEKKESFLKPQKFSSFSEWLKLFSLIFGVVVVVFIEDDDDELIRMALKKMQVSIISLCVFRIGQHVLDTDSWNHSDVATKDLWRRFSWRFNGWSRSWFKIMLWSWGPFVCQEIKLVHPRDEVDWFASAGSACEEIVKFLVQKLV